MHQEIKILPQLASKAQKSKSFSLMLVDFNRFTYSLCYSLLVSGGRAEVDVVTLLGMSISSVIIVS
jgi:hypothetical protein